MKIKKVFRRTLIGAVVATLLVGTAAAATITTRTIEANYRGIKVVVDGIEVELKDATGNSVEPFISNGTTYLPLRAIGEALGKEVSWDGTTGTVYVGKVPGAAENWMTKLPPYQYGTTGNGGNTVALYDGSDRKSYFTVSGTNYLTGITFSNTQKLAIFKAYALWNTNTYYKTMTFTLGNLDGWQRDATMEVYLDGEYSGQTYELKWDDPPKTYTIPLNYAASVKLVFTGASAATAGYGMYDISFS